MRLTDSATKGTSKTGPITQTLHEINRKPARNGVEGSPEPIVKNMISIRNVTKNFGGKNVLNGLSLEIPRGETLVIMGPSGCGKSVLLKIIAGLISADSGEIWFDGTEISSLNRKKMNILRRRIGMLFQSAALFDSMTVAENVAFMLNQHTDLDKQENT